jgi:hypothetical protein
VVEQVIDSQANVLGDLAEQDGRNIPSPMERHRGASAGSVTKLLVRAALPDLREPELAENRDDLCWREHWDAAHSLCNGNILNSDELRLEPRLSVLEQHGDDLSKIAIEIVQRLALGMRTRKPRDISDK